MKKNLLSVGLLGAVLSVNAQVLTHVDQSALFYVGEGALVYNGGGLQTKGTGMLDVHGNVMVVGTGTPGAALKTLDASGTDKTSAESNIVLRLNDPTNYATSTYGQLFIDGIAQGNITGFINKEFRTPRHGNGSYFQQIALPFYGKRFWELSTEFAKTFVQQRWTQNEILKANNTLAVNEHYQWLGHITTDPTGYYMLGSKWNNLNTETPPATMATISPTPTGSVYTVKGVPFASGNTAVSISGAAAGVNFGPGGNFTNPQYGEIYNTYIQDPFEEITSPWSGTFGKNMYQFGNPYLTNLDLKYIGYNENGGVTDGNNLAGPNGILGLIYHPGNVVTLANGSTLATNAKTVTYNTSGIAAGDVEFIIKPMQAFVLKFRGDQTPRTINFDNLRRFGMTARKNDGNTTNPVAVGYDVTAERGLTPKKSKTLKQLGVIAYNSNNVELGRTYYVVSAISKSGHQTNIDTSVQASNATTNIIGTFEEDPVNGLADPNYSSQYWLYINEANESNFRGKAVPMALYSSDITKLKFEVRENSQLIPDGKHELSSDLGFYYKASNGSLKQIKQGDEITVSSNSYGLYYGAPNGNYWDMAERRMGEEQVPSRTMVVYNPSMDNYVVRFDPDWKTANIKVYDMSGKLVVSKEQVSTTTDFVIELDKKVKTTYVVNVVSNEGKETNAKIIR